VHFRAAPDGLTRSIISELLVERDEKKRLRNTFPFGSDEYLLYDLQQNALKVIMNSYYGVSGYIRFRLYDREIGAAVTAVGRAIIEHTRQVIEGMGYRVLYGDTDSCMIQLPPGDKEATIRTARTIEEQLNETRVTVPFHAQSSMPGNITSRSNLRRSISGSSRPERRNDMPAISSGRRGRMSTRSISSVSRSSGVIPRRSPGSCSGA